MVLLALLVIVPVVLLAMFASSIVPESPPAGKPAPVADQKTAVEPAVILGLQPVDVYLNLTNKGFSKKGPSLIDGTYIIECRKEERGIIYNVAIFGPSVSSVNAIKADVIQSTRPQEETGEAAKDFLGYIASIPFKGSDPAANRQWVEEHVDGGEATLDGVKFSVNANAPFVRLLKITVGE
jgi:hypothetical protein